MSDFKLRVGSDVGGTFTDLWVWASDGRANIFKAPTSANILTGMSEVMELAADWLGLDLAEYCARIERFGHGSTVGLNALLTGRAAKTAVLTTQGFRDTLEIGRMKRQFAGLTELEVTDQYQRGRWPPAVARKMVLEVPERMDWKGSVIQPLDESQAGACLKQAVRDGVEALAICTLWSTSNGAHEKRLAEMAAEALPDAFISTSHITCPVVGEYERMSTTALNAALGPVMSHYLSEMESTFEGYGLCAPVLVMTGAGGVVSAGAASSLPASAVLSGPAAGVMGCHAAARQAGLDNVLTMDVGGTSFDVGMIHGGKPLMRARTEVAGGVILLPSIDVATIGAGGGSIASVEHDSLEVGPQSAGADPGPACYGRGGKLPTATDADLVLGILDPENFLGGRMALDMGAAKRAIRTHVAKPLGLTVNRAAWGIRRVFETRMADLLRRVSIERGHDPREFTLFATGGAGPAHAYSLCAEVGLENFAIPATATAQSAYGTGTSDLRHAAERAVYGRLSSGGQANSDQVRSIAAALKDAEAEVRAALKMDRIPHGEDRVERSLGIRYLGQTNQLEVPAGLGKPTTKSIAAAIESFEEMYEALFGRGAGFRQAGFEISHARAVGTGVLDALPGTAKGEKLKPKGSRAVIFDNPERPVKTKVFAVTHPRASTRVQGPCIIEYPGHTAVLPPGSKARADKFGNLHVRVSK